MKDERSWLKTCRQMKRVIELRDERSYRHMYLYIYIHTYTYTRIYVHVFLLFVHLLMLTYEIYICTHTQTCVLLFMQLTYYWRKRDVKIKVMLSSIFPVLFVLSSPVNRCCCTLVISSGFVKFWNIVFNLWYTDEHLQILQKILVVMCRFHI